MLEKMCDRCVNLFKACVVIGDSNIDLSKQNTYSRKLIQLSDIIGSKQIVNFYVHIIHSDYFEPEILSINLN